MKEEENRTTETNSSLPIQSRRETRNSAKAAALLRKQIENSEESIEDNKRKLP